MGEPAWSQDPQLDSADGRIAHQDVVDAELGAWTASQEKYQLMDQLQSAGVRCGAVQSAQDRLETDQQLAHRGMFPRLEHPLLGEHRFEATPIRMSGTDPALLPRWPLLGQDNAYVLKDLLGMDDAEVDELDRAGVTWPSHLPRDITVSRSLW